jgi:DNA primase
MPEIQNKSRPDNNQNIYRKIESSIRIIQNGWSDLSSSIEGYISIISKANSSIDISDYMDSKLELIYIPSNKGWSYKAYCPFHKGGNERTPSFFINKNDNRYFCQACGASGSVVDYISKMYNRPQIAVAEHILKCVNGDYSIEENKIEKAKIRKKINDFLLKMSDMHREFLLKNNTDDAIQYIMKIMKGFDLVYVYNTEKVEENIEEIFEHFKLYLKKYEQN